jgi:hypothetical protein
VHCERRSNLEADAQDLYNRFSGEWDVRPPVAGRDSFLRIHACPHDEGGGACQVTAERTA